MFQKARIKLTAWYLLIIMLVSISFSMVIYRSFSAELDRFERAERLRIERRFPSPPIIIDPDVIMESKQRLVMQLFLINGLILIGSAAAGYFLAGRTLTPIADMVEEQNRFITDASHELRTPLTAMKSEIEVTIRNKNMTLDDAKTILRSNLEEVNNLQTLSDNLIHLTGNYRIELTLVSLNTIINNAVRRISVAAKTKKISIIQKIPQSTVRGNEMLLTELFIILLDNAIKYSKSGKTIHIRAEKIDAHTHVEVIDQGYGIQQENIPHLFDRFWRADASRSKTTKGYGLGLAIAKKIISRHNGTIAVQSSVGHGTTFRVTIPS